MNNRTESEKFRAGDLSREIVRALRAGGTSLFLTFIDNAKIQQLSFQEFANQVEHTSTLIEQRWKNSQSFYILSENSVEILVWIVSLLLSSKKICLLNPFENESEILQKIPNDITAVLLTEKLVKDIQIQQFEMNVPKMESPFKLEKILTNATYHSNNFISVYTSGSTSHGKKVLQTEKGALLNIKDLIQIHKLQSTDVILTSMPVFHVNALYFTFFCSLLNSSELVLIKGFSFQNYTAALRARHITIISAFPELIRILLMKAQDLKLLLPRSFRYIVSAASYLPKDLFLNWHSQMPGRLIQGYGLSEAINFSILMNPEIESGLYLYLMTSQATPSIGKALPNNQVKILKEDMADCLPQEVGQIFLSGDYLMTSYEGIHPKEIFVQGLFPTGDLGYYIETDQLEKYFFIVGRIKDIIKINGESISFSTIEQNFSDLRNRFKDLIAIQVFDQNGFEKLGIIIQADVLHDKMEATVKIENSRFHPSFLFMTTQQLRTASGKPRRGHFANIAQNQLKIMNYRFLTLI